MTSEFGQVPAICREVGLSCKRCTEDSAHSLAAACKGLRGKAIAQLFHQIYPVSACAPMSSHFVRAYKTASANAAEIAGARQEIISLVPETPAADATPIRAQPDFDRREVTSVRRMPLFRRKSLAAAG
jgi:hypothetical protein